MILKTNIFNRLKSTFVLLYSLTTCLISNGQMLLDSKNSYIVGEERPCLSKTYTYELSNDALDSLAGQNYIWGVAQYNGPILGLSSYDIVENSLNAKSITYQFPSADSFVLGIFLAKSTSSGPEIQFGVNVSNKCCDFEANIIGSSSRMVCQGDGIFFSATGQGAGHIYNWTLDGVDVGSGRNNYINFNKSGTYNVVLGVNLECSCDDCKTVYDTVRVEVKQSPDLSVLVPSVCYYVGTAYDFTATFTPDANINWNVSGGSWENTSVNGSDIEVIWLFPGEFVVNATVSLDGCDTSLSIPITVIDNSCPSAIFNAPSQVCEGDVFTISAEYQGIGTTYNWTITGGEIISQENNLVSVKFNSAGNQSVSLEVEKCGCPKDNASKTIFVKPKPNPDIIGNVCVFIDSTMIYYTIEETSVIYNWEISGGGIATGLTNDSVSVRWENLGIKTVKLVAELDGCIDTDSKTVQVVDTSCPVANPNLPDTICQNESFLATVSDQGFGTEYFWTFGVDGSSRNRTTSYSFDETGDQVVELVMKKCSCPNFSSNKTIFVKENPYPEISGTQYGFIDSTYTFTTADIPGATYTWTTDGGSGTSTTNSISLTWDINDYTNSFNDFKDVCVTVELPNGCTNQDCFVFGLLNPDCPEADFTIDPSVCANNSVNLSAVWQGCGTDYLWSINDVQVSSGIDFDTLFSEPGLYNIQLVVTTCGCDDCLNDTLIKSLRVETAPDSVNILGPQIGLSGQSSFYTVENQAPGNTYRWTVNGGVIVGSSSNSSVQVSWNIPGIHEVCVEVVSSTSCSSSDCIMVNIVDGTPCDFPATFEFATLPLDYSIGNETIFDGGQVTAAFNTDIDSRWSQWAGVATTNQFVRNNKRDTAVLCYLDNLDPQVDDNELVCQTVSFSSPVSELEFNIYDIDKHVVNTINDPVLGLNTISRIEMVLVEFWLDNGQLLNLGNDPSNFTLGQDVRYLGNVYFTNPISEVSNLENLGDVNFHLNPDLKVDSFRVCLYQQTPFGSIPYANLEIGMGPITHCSTVPVPVEWLDVNVHKWVDNTVKVVWSTAQEINNSHFEIQRSIDNQNFETIGTVLGNGNSNQISNYEFLDQNPLNGTAYYRIKQVDFDGENSLSKTVAVNLGENNMLVFPNPASHSVTIVADTDFGKTARITLTDLSGKIVYNSENNQVSKEIKVDVSSINTGVYVLSIEGELNKAEQKLIVR